MTIVFKPHGATSRQARQHEASRAHRKSFVILKGILFVVAAVSHVDLAMAREPNALPRSSWAEGHILVAPRAGLSSRLLDSILKKRGGVGVQRIKRLRDLGVHVVKVPPRLEDLMVRKLSRSPNIAFAEKDMVVQISEVVPNDPSFTDAWHLTRIEAPRAWEASTGNGVVIAIVDSGIDGSHPDLSGRLLPGYNVISDNEDTSPVTDHGTAVAGVAAAAGNNGVGIASIAWNARILPIRITNSADGAAYTSDVAKAIRWAADNGADVANVSYGVNGSAVVDYAAQYMRSKGGVVVVAAGNAGADGNLPDSSALIAVSATNRDDGKASWSSYGSYIDVAAPGENILTTANGGGYVGASGTSFASPAAAGVIALIKSVNPELSPDQLETVLKQSADDPIGGMDWHPYFGNGRINAARAVELALNTKPADRQPPVTAISSPAAGAVKGLQQVEVSATDDIGVSQVALYAGGSLISVDTVAPYQFSWDTTTSADGTIVLTARAYDAANNEGSSEDLPITVDNVPDASLPSASKDDIAPMVAISNPTDGSKVFRKIGILIQADDNVGITRTELFIDGLLKSASGSATLEYDWDGKKVRKGKHVIRAEAYDAAGNVGSASILVKHTGLSRALRKRGRR